MAIRKRFTENEIPNSIARYDRGRILAIWCRMLCCKEGLFQNCVLSTAYGVRTALSVVLTAALI